MLEIYLYDGSVTEETTLQQFKEQQVGIEGPKLSGVINMWFIEYPLIFLGMR